MNLLSVLRISVLAILGGLLSGCGERPTVVTAPDHFHESVHGGVAIELGEHEYHLDLHHEPATGIIKGWVMDGHVVDFVRISAPSIELEIATEDATNRIQLTAVENPSTGETIGNTSQFEGSAPWLQSLNGFSGTIVNLEIRGHRYSSVPFRYPPAATR